MYFLIIMEAKSSRSRCQHLGVKIKVVFASSESLQMAGILLCLLHMVFSLGDQISSSYKDTSQTELGPTLMNSF